MVTVVPEPSEPSHLLADGRELLDAFLDHYRAAVLRKLHGLTEQQLRTGVLPSGWTPLELLVHLTWVERRWLQWGFAAEPIAQPWGDQGPDGRWQVPAGASADALRAAFQDACERSRRAAGDAPLERRAAVGGRFGTPAEAPTLGWILCHLLQEYARHVGHLDAARELLDGTVGE